jgi:hypothetical protein
LDPKLKIKKKIICKIENHELNTYIYVFFFFFSFPLLKGKEGFLRGKKIKIGADN